MNNYIPLHEHFNNVHNYINNHIIRGLYEPSVILLEDSNGSWIQRMWTAVLNWFDKLSGEVKTFYKETLHIDHNYVIKEKSKTVYQNRESILKNFNEANNENEISKEYADKVDNLNESRNKIIGNNIFKAFLDRYKEINLQGFNEVHTIANTGAVEKNYQSMLNSVKTLTEKLCSPSFINYYLRLNQQIEVAFFQINSVTELLMAVISTIDDFFLKYEGNPTAPDENPAQTNTIDLTFVNDLLRPFKNFGFNKILVITENLYKYPIINSHAMKFKYLFAKYDKVPNNFQKVPIYPQMKKEWDLTKFIYKDIASMQKDKYPNFIQTYDRIMDANVKLQENLGMTISEIDEAQLKSNHEVILNYLSKYTDNGEISPSEGTMGNTGVKRGINLNDNRFLKFLSSNAQNATTSDLQQFFTILSNVEATAMNAAGIMNASRMIDRLFSFRIDNKI